VGLRADGGKEKKIPSLALPGQKPNCPKMDVRFGTWNVRSIYRAGLLKMAKYNLDLVAVHEVRWVEGVSQQNIVHFCMEMGMLITT